MRSGRLRRVTRQFGFCACPRLSLGTCWRITCSPQRSRRFAHVVPGDLVLVLSHAHDLAVVLFGGEVWCATEYDALEGTEVVL